MAFSCELPEELARIVKAFAKPAFIHWRLFKEAKHVLPTRHWADLSAALSVRNADNVCDALTAYIVAAHIQIHAVKTLIGDTGNSTWCHETQSVLRVVLTPEQRENNRRLCDEAVLAESSKFKAYRALLVEIHGEPTVEYAEYLDRRRDRYGWNEYAHPLTLRDWDETDGYYEDEDA